MNAWDSVRTVLGVVFVLTLTRAAWPQEELKKALEPWNRRIKDIDNWKEKRIGEERAEWQKQAAEARKVMTLGQVLLLEGANDYQAATEKLELWIRQYEASPTDRLARDKRAIYAGSLLEVGRLYAVMGDPDNKAHDLVLNGWKAQHELYADSPQGQPVLVQSSLAVGAVLLMIGRPEEAAEHVHRARDLCEKLWPRSSSPEVNPLLAYCWLAEAELANATEKYHAAEHAAEEARALLEKQYPEASYPNGHPELAVALSILAGAKIHLGEGREALPLLEKAQVMLEHHFPNPHPGHALIQASLAAAHLQCGDEIQALASIDAARAKCLRLFPKDPKDKYDRGHPALIQAMTSLGDLLQQFGQLNKARDLNKDAWTACEHFYHGDHENKVVTLLAYGRSLRASGARSEALTRFQEAEAMAGRLYPDKPHATRALCLLHLGSIQAHLGRYAAARQAFEQARDMYHQLDPKESCPGGYPYLSGIALYLGALHLQLKDPERAREAFAQALSIDQQQLQGFARTAAEADALAFARARQVSLYGYLAATRGARDTDAAAYAHVWTVKGAVTRVLQDRRTDVRLAQEKLGPARGLWEKLIDTQTQLSGLRHATREDPKVRGQRLAELTNKAALLEIELSRLVPELRQRGEMDRRGFADLAEQLPAGSAFIDLVRYEDFLNGAGPQRGYVAFVLTPRGAPERIDLGPARRIDEAVKEWRVAVEGWKPKQPPDTQRDWQERSDRQAARLRDLVWEPMAKHLPAGTRLVYLAPDGDLACFPFAALPGRKPDTILLEEHAFAYVPHGPFLLDQLLHPAAAPANTGRFLALGAVRYDPPDRELKDSPYPFLKGTVEAVKLARGLAKSRDTVILEGSDATSEALCAALPAARFAHLATHGFFRKADLESEHEQVKAYLRSWDFGVGAPAAGTGLGRQSPLSFTGLVLAGANDPGRAGRGGGILTGATISELPLDRLYLVTLLGCETGLGELAQGEAVQGLPLAFHLAGCPNVVCSLWPVYDGAGRELMKEFYCQLWERGLPPVEAMHLAQLEIYRHPERLTDLGGRSGADWKAPRRVLPPPVSETLPERPSTAGRSHVQLWAAFVHSGAGR